MLLHMLLAGFGGQGILFAGKVAAQVGMLKEKQVSWLPSYGPEMRGGTANCSVCIDDAPIGSPIVSEPQTLIVMNAPSFDKFSDKVKPGGMIVLDSSCCISYHVIRFVISNISSFTEKRKSE